MTATRITAAIWIPREGSGNRRATDALIFLGRRRRRRKV